MIRTVPSRSRYRVLAVLLLILFCRRTWAEPGTDLYRVRKGDTLELLAAEYYGNRVHKIYIMIENNINRVRSLNPGETLKIPLSHTITIAPGDTLAGLAETYLGHAKRVDYLAEVNNLSPQATVALGEEITVPMRVSYRAKKRETLKNIAMRHFSDPKLVRLIRNYNQLRSDVLRKGQTISIPVPHVKIQASKRRPMDADATTRIAQRKEMHQKARQALPKAQSAWNAGNFGLAKQELIKLDTDYLDSALAARVGVLLGAVYLAFDDSDSAIAIFSKVLKRRPKFKLVPKVHSPKVRQAWTKAQENLD